MFPIQKAGESMSYQLPVSQITFIYFRRYEESCRFLREYFGLEEVIDYGYARLYRTTAHGFIGAVNFSQVSRPQTADKGVTLCVAFDSLEHLQQCHADLASRGLNLPPVKKSKRLSYYSFTVPGPEGYHFEFGTFILPEEAALLNPPPTDSLERE